MVSDDELKDYQDPESWESSSDDKRPPLKGGRAIVSVAFSRSDFEFVADAARAAEMKTSEFIRAAAIDRAVQNSKRATIVSASSHLQIRTPYPSGSLRVGNVTRSESESKTFSDQTLILTRA